MIRTTALMLSLGLVACAPVPPPEPGPGGSVRTSTADDCAIFGAIAIEHYRLRENPPPPLWNPVRSDSGEAYRLTCGWSRYGLSFPDTYDPESPVAGRVRWVKFEAPRYDGRGGATVATEIMHGPLAGMGYECDMVLTDWAGWTLDACRTTWVS